MLKKRLFGLITLMVGVMLIFTLMGCGGGGGGGGIVRPDQINGYYGVTAAGNIIEVILEDGTTLTINYSGKDYVIKIDGVEKSKGTASKTGSTITFTPSDGSTVNNVNLNYNGDPTGLSVTKANDGKTYTAQTIVTSSDYFYAIGGPTSRTEADIKNNFLTAKTPAQIKTYLVSNLIDYDSEEGTFDEIAAFGKFWKCPNSELSRISEEMNSGKFYGIGYYKHSQYGNIVYCVSRLPFSSY